ncbi:hypothetical protein ALC60_04932 [Trachymyrmex zeteki]|uniref:PDZ domain-containing protein n=1 Tax=Mycetomoellerius zeteki TaxID=64791 RepID=A0A151X740_9HYME|nr:hypothetical protein ALC60_04932 [Trachymyrmex zeteki]
MVDAYLGGYVILLTSDNGRVKLYGSPADNGTLEVSDEILEVNGRTLENATHTEVIQYIHECIDSRTICLRLRRSGNRNVGESIFLFFISTFLKVLYIHIFLAI